MPIGIQRKPATRPRLVAKVGGTGAKGAKCVREEALQLVCGYGGTRRSSGRWSRGFDWSARLCVSRIVKRRSRRRVVNVAASISGVPEAIVVAQRR